MRNAFIVLFIAMIGAGCCLQGSPSNTDTLAITAVNAIQSSDADLFDEVLQNGFQLNAPIDGVGANLTALHYAVGLNKTNMVEHIVQRGATLHIRDVLNRRPIDIAYGEGDNGMCKLLSTLCSEDATAIAGCPKEIVETLFRIDSMYWNDEILLDIDGIQMSDELLDWVRARWSKAKPMNASISAGEDSKKERSGRPVYCVELKKISEQSYKYRCALNVNPLAGFAVSGTFKRAYGHWFNITDGGGEM